MGQAGRDETRGRRIGGDAGNPSTSDLGRMLNAEGNGGFESAARRLASAAIGELPVPGWLDCTASFTGVGGLGAGSTAVLFRTLRRGVLDGSGASADRQGGLLGFLARGAREETSLSPAFPEVASFREGDFFVADMGRDSAGPLSPR